MAATMGFRREGRVLVILHGRHSPSDLEWATFLKEMQTYGPRQQLRVVTYSYGGGPDGKQRKTATDLNKDPARHDYVMVALLTSSAIMRGMGAALSWFLRNMKVFGLDADAEAFKFLGLSPAESTFALATRRQLERELGVTKADATTD
jgi:hypothetical protein